MQCSSPADCATPASCQSVACNAGMCEVSELPDDAACDDADPCSIGDRCVAGVCSGEDGRLFSETFSDDSKDWTFLNNFNLDIWQIGTATASTCDTAAPNTGEDPSDDASFDNLDARRGIAATGLGSCIDITHDLAQGCMLSPPFPSAKLDGMWLSFAQHRHFEGAGGPRFVDRGWHARVVLVGADANFVSDIYTVDPSQSNNDTAWTPAFVEMPATSEIGGSEMLQLEFCFSYSKSGSASDPLPSRAAGWSIDDVLVAPKDCTLK